MKPILSEAGWREGERVLLYGIGNVGRQDDGLGVRLIERLESAELPETFSLEANYQLNIEDALLISGFDLVLIADASAESKAEAPFSVRPVAPSAKVAFTTHAMAVEGVLSLCEELYGRHPRTFLLALPGYEWDVTEQLSPKAEQNLDSAFQALLEELPCTRSR